MPALRAGFPLTEAPNPFESQGFLGFSPGIAKRFNWRLKFVHKALSRPP
jgi:hypothetical protein